ncbi:sensor histidine kinase [Cedecea neteri]|uniref:histidine kinase n=1 Tax=Cedecea neteri TaxID=158822 RepID=A0A291E1X8_9ENTR|nr:ATP-binding protein [Cedecea neteri]ATF93983.1 sensor histidine kinase [Cedecea neteri]
MLRIISWLLLTLLSCAGLGAWFLQQQYQDKSADFRILYREITVKLSQHDAIIPLLPASQDAGEVQKILPQIVLWRRHNNLEPRLAIVPESNGRYWLNRPNLSLLIDLPTLLDTLGEKKTFQHLSISWNNTILCEQGNANAGYWRWDKAVASPTQPFLVSASDSPEWAELPWWLIVSPAIFWALALYLLTQYQANKRRRDIADLRARYAELTRLNTMGELAAGMMHELNQPLTAIMSYNQAAVRLIKQENPAQVPDLLDAAVLQIKRIDALLSQFRQKLTSERAEYQRVDLPPLWQRVCRLLDNELSSGKIRATSQFADDLPPLFAPPLWVEQILHNIASNAIQAQTSGAGWIHLDATIENQGIALTLTDGGPGLSPEALEQVFIPFFTTRAQGVGLGMALADTLVQRLNGTIEVSNMPGGGACFRLWFPLRDEEKLWNRASG